MNYLEFKRQLMVDPYDRNPDFQAARNRDGQHADAVASSDQFEQLLQQALSVEVPPGLTDQIVIRTKLEEQERMEQKTSSRGAWWPRAVAASVLAAALTAGAMNWNQSRQDSMAAFVVQHWQHDGQNALVRAEHVGHQQRADSLKELRRVLAAAGVEADEKLLQRITFGKNCPTPKGTGAHLVINTESGPITVFYAPEIGEQARRLSIDDVVAVLIEMQDGAAAFIGEDEGSVREVGELVKSNLRPMSTRT